MTILLQFSGKTSRVKLIIDSSATNFFLMNVVDASRPERFVQLIKLIKSFSLSLLLIRTTNKRGNNKKTRYSGKEICNHEQKTSFFTFSSALQIKTHNRAWVLHVFPSLRQRLKNKEIHKNTNHNEKLISIKLRKTCIKKKVYM